MNFLVVLCIIVFALIFYKIYKDQTKKPSCGQKCGETPEGIIFYSNRCQDTDQENINYVNGYLTGERWECVEFVRRFLILTKGITFGEIANAHDIWDLPSFQKLNGEPVPIIKIKKIRNIYPEKGDILVWNKQVDEKGTGHVAIVTDMDRKGNLFVSEQNWDKEACMGKNYSRIIRVENDPSIIGWIRLFL